MPQVALERIRQIAERVATSEGIEVVEVELRGKGPRCLLRIFIDKPGGVTHGDCELISTQVGAILDVEDLVPVSYTLEVSSPGVERRLCRPADYARFSGKKVRLILKEPVGGHHQIAGRLEGLDNGIVSITSNQGQTERVELANIERANLVFEWNKSSEQ